MNEGIPTRLIISFGPEVHVGGAIWRQATQEEMLILWQLGVRIACQAVTAADIGTARTPRRFRVNGIVKTNDDALSVIGHLETCHHE